MKVKIEIRYRNHEGSPDSLQFLVLKSKDVKLLGFEDVVFTSHNLTIRKSSISDIRYNKVRNSRISMPVNEDLLGEYELVKIHDELFQLVKIEENGNKN